MSQNMLAKAIELASVKHCTQLDKGGNPYILHPIRVMMRLRTRDEELMQIAILHDVVEDTDVSWGQLVDMGFSKRVISALKLLTKVPGQTYDEFIDGLKGNLDALLVKREDLRDNSDITRMKGLTEKDFLRTQKYMVSFDKVESFIKDHTVDYII